MQRIFASAFLALSLIAPALARAESHSDASASLFAERTALLAVDSKCALLAPQVRGALAATTIQARGGAFRDGWSDARLDGVATRAAQAGRTRDCKDPLVLASAQRATNGYLGWAKSLAISLPGAASGWTARRFVDGEGWMLWQSSGAMRFGLRKIGDDPAFTALTLPLSAQGAPSGVQLYFRDTNRAAKPFVGVPGLLVSSGLAATAPPHTLAVNVLASTIRTETIPKAAPRLSISFPASAIAQMARLDPRESAEIVLTWPGSPPQRYYVEIGDLAVASAFLAAAV
jgi:hypothetical protein